MTTGLDWKRELAEQSEEDWVLGAIYTPGIADVPTDERLACLPQGELQRGKEDFMDCASRAPLNILETQYNYILRNDKLTPENRLWLAEKGYITDSGVEFSDRFVAMNSNTTRSGNSLKAPLEAIRKQGLIPKAMLPANSEMTWDDYHNQDDITYEMKALGKEFARRFTINYEKVYASAYPHIIDKHMINCGGYAWPKPKNGEYPAVPNTPNHAFVIVKDPLYIIFDNYLDEGKDGDWIKKLAPDYNFLPYGYRVYISWEGAEKSWLNTIFTWLLSFLR